MKSIDWLENQLVEFINSLTISYVFFREREKGKTCHFEREIIGYLVEKSLSQDHIEVQPSEIDLGSFLEFFAWFMKLGGRGLVG